MLRLTPCYSARLQHNAVLGAEVPVFRRFPYRAHDILHLYRDFWRLILRYPENERHDLIFKLRNEFRSKKNMGHPKLIGKAYAKGQSLLDMYKGRIEYGESVTERRLVSRVGASEVRKERHEFNTMVKAAAAAAGVDTAAVAARRPPISTKQQIRNNILGLDDDEADNINASPLEATLRTAPQRRPLSNTSPIALGGSSSVNTLWEQIQQGTHSTIPNLRHYRHSKALDGKSGARKDIASTFVPSR